MSINLVLNSRDSVTYAGGQAKFVTKWSQFPSEVEKYNVSFSFITEVDGDLDNDDLYTLSLDNIGSTIKNIRGGNYNSSTTTHIGYVLPEQPHSSANTRLRADYSTNPPVTIIGRPNNDLLEISFRDLTGTLLQKTPQFILFIRFEAI